MRLIDGGLRLSASDLMRFKGCRHAAALDLRRIEKGDITPGTDSEEALLLQRQGDAHEAAFLGSLRDAGHGVTEIAKDGISLETAVAHTRAAMAAGAEVIFQGAFLGGSWGGYSDFLERVDRPSQLGNWSYEVVDTKLKRSPDPKHVLQLALYSDLLAEMQGAPPERAHLELGNGERFTIRLDDVSAYARQARRAFENFIADRPPTRPEPVAACAQCLWTDHCKAEWDRTDSLALVAGISRSQRDKLEAAGIATLGALAAHEGRVPRLAPETQDRLRTQAALQASRRAGGSPSFSLRPYEAGRGFALLPEADDGDIFYDIEGDPYHPGGLEYLHGLWLRDEGEWHFRAFWAHDRAAEGRAVEELLGFLSDHMRRHPQAHIYHYANYEIAALRRLTTMHRVGEAAMDQLQRERRFVDLFKVVSGALIASEPGYSIKNLEAFYMEARDGDVATAGASVVYYEKWRDGGDDSLLAQIEEYNRTDCISTQLLRDWLVDAVRPAGLSWPMLAPDARPDGGQRIDDDAAAMAARYDAFGPARERLGIEAADLLFDVNYFHEREDKPKYWAIFDRLAQDSEVLVDDLDCVFGLEATGPAITVKQSTERDYRFPPQETKLRAGKRPCIKPAALPESVLLVAIAPEAGTATLRRGKKSGDLPDRLDLLPERPRNNSVMRDAIAAVSDGLIANDGRHRAIEHLLTRAAPQFHDGPRAAIIPEGGDLVIETSRAIAAMDETTLAIQGPPGTGKTFVSAWAIVDLIAAGKRIAISSQSHKAIENLVTAIAERAELLGERPLLVHKAGDDDDEDQRHPLITVVSDNDAPEIAAADVVGGTAWHFARYGTPAYDYLFIDEAGQVSLANVVAMSRAARNIVLVGDPMQLPQPIQGAHPGRSGESALEYLLDGARIVPADRGIFMPESRRMHPGVCAFISKAVYEDRLGSHASTARQSIRRPGETPVLGARFNPVEHAGCSQVCAEEITAIARKIEDLVGSEYIDREGVSRPLARGDFLVVAPYNAQVNALKSALPDIRIGTVDKFQGQEAPVCLISMTTSSADELPRDIAFLYSLNRINVAVSRAQVLAVLFASPRLLDVPCRTIRDMALVNTLCLLAEHSASLDAPSSK